MIFFYSPLELYGGCLDETVFMTNVSSAAQQCVQTIKILWLK